MLKPVCNCKQAVFNRKTAMKFHHTVLIYNPMVSESINGVNVAHSLGELEKHSSSITSRKLITVHFKLTGHDRFLPHPSQYIIHKLPYHQRYITNVVDKL
jgi:hypothetical protein